MAELAGVSQSAVSRAFTPGASLSDALRQKVEAAAAQLHYRPNLIARSLITRRSGTIAIAVSDLENQFYTALLQDLSRAFGDCGYRLLLFAAPRQGGTDPMLEEILRYQVDAVLLAAALRTSRFAEECRRMGVPVVLLNRKTADTHTSSVTVDNRAGGRAVAELLAARGHRRCAFMAGLESSSTSRDREAGFRAGLKFAGFAPFARVAGQFDAAQAREATRLLLHARERPDALFCANDHMAMAAIETARMEFGLTIGRDLSVVGFDDVPLAAWPSFSLTTYSQPVERMVERVLAITLGHLQDAEYRPVHAVVQGELRLRASVRGGA